MTHTVEEIIQEIERRMRTAKYEAMEQVSYVEYVVLKELLNWIKSNDEKRE